MPLALDRPGAGVLFTSWAVQPLAIVALVVAAVAYARGVQVLRRRGTAWSTGRSATFVVGLLLFGWTTCGFAQAYASSLYWVWTSQTLMLWLAVPLLVLSGQPVQLARAVSGETNRLDRVLGSRGMRAVANPLVGPALVPVLSFALFFGPFAGWTISVPAVGWIAQLVLVLVGGLMVLPLVGLDEDSSSLAVGLSLAIGSFELVLDALPGIVLRLKNNITTDWFAQRDVHSWSPIPIHDQSTAGGILWCIAELIDLPFLVLVYRRWLRADARDAARVDAVLEAERTARQGLRQDITRAADSPATDVTDPESERDVPWWLSDPEMQERLRRR